MVTFNLLRSRQGKRDVFNYLYADPVFFVTFCFHFEVAVIVITQGNSSRRSMTWTSQVGIECFGTCSSGFPCLGLSESERVMTQEYQLGMRICKEPTRFSIVHCSKVSEVMLDSSCRHTTNCSYADPARVWDSSLSSPWTFLGRSSYTEHVYSDDTTFVWTSTPSRRMTFSNILYVIHIR